MPDRLAKPVGGSSTLLMALLAMICHGTAHPALPPAAASSQEPAPASGSGAVAAEESAGATWALPPIRMGGTLQYGLRRDSFDGQQRSQTGLTATLNASTNTYIWQPWFARVSGGLGFTSSTDNSGSVDASSSSRSVLVTGSGQLSVLPQSKYPFEAHFQRNDTRVSSDLAVANGYAGQRYGFTQRYIRPEGDASLAWDRTTQTSVDTGRDLQDSLQLRMTHAMENHRLNFNGDRATNTRELTGENAVQTNLSIQDSYTPDPSISVESLANVSDSNFHLQQGDNTSRVLQLSSNAFWRPDGQPMTLNGGVRVFAVGADSTGLGISGGNFEARSRNVNANVGVNYEISRFTRIYASANVNMSDVNGQKNTNTNQSVGANYQPDSIELGAFRYNWGTSANATNSTGGEGPQRQLALQFSHSLSRSFNLAGGSTVVVDANQGLGVSASNTTSSNDGASTQRVNHGVSVAWDLSQQSGSALVRLSANDSRALDGNQEFFQLINFQASSNMPTSSYSSWSGNLTIQAVRQSSNTNVGTTSQFGIQNVQEPDKGFVTTSSGSVSYQNQRLFGVRRLRFVSDLRLNGQSLLPLFSSEQDQEVAAWDNRLDYFIGRTQLRVNLLFSSNGAKKTSRDPITNLENVENVKKINRSIMFSVSRSFGNF